MKESSGGAARVAGRLLVVDDDRDLAESIQDLFETTGYKVIAVETVEEALEQAAGFDPDVALVDVRLGQHSGLDLLSPLKKLCPYVECVMMTGYAATDTVIESMRLDAYDYLHKPVELDLLQATIDRCISIVNLKRDKAVATSALRASEQKYRRLVESLQDEYFFFSYDRDRKVTYVSPSVRNVLGYHGSELEWFGEAFTDSPLNEKALEASKQALEGAQVAYEVDVTHRDGGVHRLAVSESPSMNAAGDVVAVDGIAHDITERIASQEQFKRLANATYEAIIVFDSGAVVESNRRFSELFRIPEGQVKGVDPQSLVVPDARKLLAERLEIMDDEPYVVEALRLDGTTFSAEIRTRWIHFQGQRVRVSAIRDLTQLREAEAERLRMQEQLRQAQKMEAIGQLTGGIAHDFNNMLQGILGYAGLMARRLEDGDTGRVGSCLEHIRETAQQACDLISQLLVYSRGGTATAEPLDLSEVVAQALRIVRSTIPTSIELRTRFSEDASRVLTDRVQMQQVVMNLCINARDAIEGDEGRIDLTLRDVSAEGQCASCHATLEGHFVELSVKDTGSGFDEALLAQMFDPFFTTKEVGKGTGMGLAVVHGVIHEHKGHFLVSSKPGEGAEFRLLFPPCDEAVVAQPRTEMLHATVEAGKGRIMVVDDAPVLAQFLADLLEDSGYEVTTFTDPKQAFEKFEAAPDSVDLVITDQTMPGLPGDRLASAMLEIRPALPIVLCTGYSESIDADRAAELKIMGFLEKPFKANEILRMIADFLNTT